MPTQKKIKERNQRLQELMNIASGGPWISTQNIDGTVLFTTGKHHIVLTWTFAVLLDSTGKVVKKIVS